MYEMFTDKNPMRGEDYLLPADQPRPRLECKHGTILYGRKCFNCERELQDSVVCVIIKAQSGDRLPAKSEESIKMKVKELKDMLGRLVTSGHGECEFKLVVESNGQAVALPVAMLLVDNTSPDDKKSEGTMVSVLFTSEI